MLPFYPWLSRSQAVMKKQLDTLKKKYYNQTETELPGGL